MIEYILPKGIVESWSYDDKNNMIEHKPILDTIHRYQYDDHGNRIKGLYKDGVETWVYDNNNICVKYVDFENNVTTRQGNSVVITDKNGKVICKIPLPDTSTPINELTLICPYGNPKSHQTNIISPMVTLLNSLVRYSERKEKNN